MNDNAGDEMSGIGGGGWAEPVIPVGSSFATGINSGRWIKGGIRQGWWSDLY